MSSALEALYHTIESQPCDNPHYQDALLEWEQAKGGTWLDLEDAAMIREYERGFSTFAAGLRLGLSLAYELSALFPEE